MSRTIESLITALKAAAQEEIALRESGDTSAQWQDEATPENVLRLVEALSAKQAEPVGYVASEALDYKNFDNVIMVENASGRRDIPLYTTPPANSPVVPEGWKLVPIVPTEKMVIDGFESEPNKSFSNDDVWEEYQAMSGCRQAAHRAKLCWDAMLATAPVLQNFSNGWIKCSDRMPEDDDFVLIYPLPDFGVDLHVGQYIKFHKKGPGWFAQVSEQNYGIEFYPITVTHWMPLPSAPEKPL